MTCGSSVASIDIGGFAVARDVGGGTPFAKILHQIPREFQRKVELGCSNGYKVVSTWLYIFTQSSKSYKQSLQNLMYIWQPDIHFISRSPHFSVGLSRKLLKQHLFVVNLVVAWHGGL